MFHYEGALPHLLSPRDYYDEAPYQREIEALFRPSWRLLGLLEDVPRPGDYLARDVLGVPVLLRNLDGELHAYKNVCPHRHCLVLPYGKGHAPSFRCQYHGWEFGAEGRISKIPDGISFKGLRARELCLERYRLSMLGSLVFVNLSPGSESFLESVGDIAPDLERFYENHRPFMVKATEHAVNWKVIAENAIESYHVPVTHPGSFKEYRDEKLHDHLLDMKFTRYRDLKPWGNSPLGLSFKMLTGMMLKNPTYQRFTQAHLFPNYLLYYGDLFSSFISLEPLGPQRTRHYLTGFVPREIRYPLITRAAQKAFEVAFKRTGWKIIEEDMAIWDSIQSGLRNSHHRGALSRREERVYTFQKYLVEKLEGQSTNAASRLERAR